MKTAPVALVRSGVAETELIIHKHEVGATEGHCDVAETRETLPPGLYGEEEGKKEEEGQKKEEGRRNKGRLKKEEGRRNNE